MLAMTPEEHFDAIVVGSGATGGFAAKELTERGLQVLVLEAGSHLPEALFEKAATATFASIGSGARIKAGIKGQHRQALTSFFTPEKSFLFVTDNKECIEDLKEKYLETEMPKIGGVVKILKGEHSQKVGKLHSRDKKNNLV